MIINLVKQEADNDCVLACVAIASNYYLSDVRRKAISMGIGCPVGINDEYRLLVAFDCVYFPSINSDLYANSIYLASVPSINFPGLLHRLVIQLNDTEICRVIDPQQGTGKKYYTIDTLKCWTDILKIERLKL